MNGSSDPLFFWRLQDELTVPDAAILMIGEDPSQKEAIPDDNHTTSQPQRRSYARFESAFKALKSAILRGQIQAKIAYDIRKFSDPHGTPREGFKLVSSLDLYKLIDDAPRDPFGIFRNTERGFFVQISEQPDWEQTRIEVESLRAWLRSKGAVDGFFISSLEAKPKDSFLDKHHDHFSPELALAVTVWEALHTVQHFKGTPKAAITKWIDEHEATAWQGDEPPGEAAKERIITLVNWRKGGGAPKSGG